MITHFKAHLLFYYAHNCACSTYLCIMYKLYKLILCLCFLLYNSYGIQHSFKMNDVILKVLKPFFSNLGLSMLKGLHYDIHVLLIIIYTYILIPLRRGFSRKLGPQEDMHIHDDIASLSCVACSSLLYI